MRWLNYSLDNQPDVELTITQGPRADGPGHYEIALASITNLPEGLHQLYVHGESTFNATLQATNFFTIINKTATPSNVAAPTPNSIAQPTSSISSSPSEPAHATVTPTIPPLSAQTNNNQKESSQNLALLTAIIIAMTLTLATLALLHRRHRKQARQS
jgi:hypothetical protein